MQVFDLTSLSSIAAAVISIVLSTYLFLLWKRQDNRLITDLPLMFGITFIAHGFSNIIQTLSYLGFYEMTLDIFRVRAMVICGIALPMVGVLIHIWLPRWSKYHLRMLGLLLLYWIAVVLVGPSEEIIMALLIPILLVMFVGLILTFTITWRTGRLKEVRSDLLVVSLILALISQTGKLALMSMGLGAIADFFMVASTICGTLAIVNPWYRVSTPPPTTSYDFPEEG